MAAQHLREAAGPTARRTAAALHDRSKMPQAIASTAILIRQRILRAVVLYARFVAPTSGTVGVLTWAGIAIYLLFAREGL